MVKRHTTLNIEDELIQEAKKKFLNISEITANAIRDKLGNVEVEINNDIKQCEFCGIELPKQTAKDLTKGLCWLYPDEKWICPRCLKSKIRRVSIAGKQ